MNKNIEKDKEVSKSNTVLVEPCKYFGAPFPDLSLSNEVPCNEWMCASSVTQMGSLQCVGTTEEAGAGGGWCRRRGQRQEQWGDVEPAQPVSYSVCPG